MKFLSFALFLCVVLALLSLPSAAIRAPNVTGYSARPEGGFIFAGQGLFALIDPVLTAALQNLQNTNFPEIREKTLSLHIFDMHFYDLNAGSINLAFNSQGLALATSNFRTRFHLRFDGKEIFKFSGQCNPDLKDLAISALLSFGAPVNGRPTVQLGEFNLHLGDISLNCDGLIGNLADLLVDLFKGTIKSVIAKEAQKLLTNVVDNEFNSDLQKLKLIFPITNGFADVDFSIVSTATSAQGAMIGAAAVVYPSASPGIQFPFPAPTPSELDPSSCTSGMVAVALSTFSLNTVGYTYFQGGRLARVWPNVVSALDLALILPGFSAKLGPSALLNLTLSARAYPIFSTVPSNSELSAVMPIAVTLSGAEDTEFSLGATAAIGFSLRFTNLPNGGGAIVLGVDTLALNNAAIVNTTVGGNSTILPSIITLISGVINKDVLPVINTILADSPIPLPSIDGYDVSLVNFDFAPSVVCVGLSVKPSGGKSGYLVQA